MFYTDQQKKVISFALATSAICYVFIILLYNYYSLPDGRINYSHWMNLGFIPMVTLVLIYSYYFLLMKELRLLVVSFIIFLVGIGFYYYTIDYANWERLRNYFIILNFETVSLLGVSLILKDLRLSLLCFLLGIILGNCLFYLEEASSLLVNFLAFEEDIPSRNMRKYYNFFSKLLNLTFPIFNLIIIFFINNLFSRSNLKELWKGKLEIGGRGFVFSFVVVYFLNFVITFSMRKFYISSIDPESFLLSVGYFASILLEIILLFALVIITKNRLFTIKKRFKWYYLLLIVPVINLVPFFILLSSNKSEIMSRALDTEII